MIAQNGSETTAPSIPFIERIFEQMANTNVCDGPAKPAVIDFAMPGVRLRLPVLAHDGKANLERSDTIMIRVCDGSVYIACFKPDSEATPDCFDVLNKRHLPLAADVARTIEHSAPQYPIPTLPLLTDHICNICLHLLHQNQRNDLVTPVLSLSSEDLSVTSASIISCGRCDNCCTTQPPDLISEWCDGQHYSESKQLNDYRLPISALVNPFCGVAASAITRAVEKSSLLATTFAAHVRPRPDLAPEILWCSGIAHNYHSSLVASLFESFERQAGMSPLPTIDRVTAARSKLQARAIDPTLLFRYNEDSYGTDWNLSRYSNSDVIDWVPGLSLYDVSPTLIPFQLVFYPASSLTVGPKLVDNNSSGMAVGSTLQDASLRALLELLERDGFMWLWYLRREVPIVDLKTIEHAEIEMLLSKLHSLGYRATLLDCRVDVDVPIIVAIVRRPGHALAVGGAARLDPYDAMLAALREASSAIVHSSRLFSENEAHLCELKSDYQNVRTVLDHALLYTDPDMAARISWLYADRPQASVAELFGAHIEGPSQRHTGLALDALLARVREAGIEEVAMVDLTSTPQALIGVRTVRVVVPGLVPIDFGFPKHRFGSLPSSRTAAKRKIASERATILNDLPHPFP